MSGRAGIVTIGFFYVETVWVEPVFAVNVGFASMDVRRFILLIGVEE